MKVYISGKIGEEVISDATRQKFARAENMLKAKGFEVFNPCDVKWTKALERGYNSQRYPDSGVPVRTIPFYDYALLRDLMALSGKDAIYMLADWEHSHGCHVELDFAFATGKKLYWEAEEDTKIYCDEIGNYIGEWLPIEEVSG